MTPIGDDLASLHAGVVDEMVETFKEAVAVSDFVGGAAVADFEAAWSHYCGAEHAVGTSSGTSALHMSLNALGIGRGDEVLVPANTFFATVEAIARTGARAVYCDVSPSTMLIDLADAENRVTSRTRAVVVVHLYGNMCDVDAAGRLAARHGLTLVEDAAQAHGSRWQGRRSGGLGNVACYSFYPGKNLGALGDAGAVVTDSAEVAAAVRSASDHGRPPGRRDMHTRIGGSERLDALQARFLTVKLRHLDRWNRRRRELAAYYRANLPVGRVDLIAEEPGAESAYHQFVITVEDREQIARDLRSHGVETRVHYPVPCHAQPASIDWVGPVSLPVVEHLAPRILSLPCSPSLSDGDVERVVEAVRRCT